MANIQELEINDLNIPWLHAKSLKVIQSLPTKGSISCLRLPRGSCWQTIFFIGLFEHLEDLMILNDTLKRWEHELVVNLTLTPTFCPLL